MRRSNLVAMCWSISVLTACSGAGPSGAPDGGVEGANGAAPASSEAGWTQNGGARDGATADAERPDGATPPPSSDMPDGTPHTDGGPGAVGAPPSDAGLRCPTTAQSLYVDATNSGPRDGTRARPFSTISAAIASANTGAGIHVAAGAYRENLLVSGKTLVLCGGFAGDFQQFDPHANVTTVQGDGAAPAVQLASAGDSQLIGLRITGGGGGVEVTGSGSPTIAGNLIEGNMRPEASDSSRGGGIFVYHANAVVVGNVIRGNRADRGAGVATSGDRVELGENVVEANVGTGTHGGGLYVMSRVAVLRGNLVRGNEIGRSVGYGWGGGMMFLGSGNTATISHNEVTDNWAPSDGSGTFIDEGGTATLDHELIHHNRCNTRGGVGLYVDGGSGVRSTVVVVNSTIANHRCPSTAEGNGIYASAGTDVTVKNSILWDNAGRDFSVRAGSTLALSYTLSEQVATGTGNLQGDPLFADPSTADYHLRSRAGRFHLGQWVIDAESSSALDHGAPADDFSMESTPNGGRIDLGNYGNTPEASRSGS